MAALSSSRTPGAQDSKKRSGFKAVTDSPLAFARRHALSEPERLTLMYCIDRLDFEFFGITRVAYGTS